MRTIAAKVQEERALPSSSQRARKAIAAPGLPANGLARRAREITVPKMRPCDRERTASPRTRRKSGAHTMREGTPGCCKHPTHAGNTPSGGEAGPYIGRTHDPRDHNPEATPNRPRVIIEGPGEDADSGRRTGRN